MALPKVSITLGKGGLGRVPESQDGVAALIHTGTAVSSKLALKKAYPLFSVADAEALGLSSSTNAEAYEQVIDFYERAGQGSALWLMLVGESETFANILSSTGDIAKVLIETANGRIRLLGISHVEKKRGTLVAASGGLKGNIHSAVPLAQGLATSFASKNQPFHVILAGNEMDDMDTLKDYSSASHTRVSMLIGGTKVSEKVAAIGLTLGQLAQLPVQRSLARVKNGSLPISAATFTQGEAVEHHNAKYSSLHSKRYLFFRTYTGRVGYYFADDTNLASTTNDVSTIADSRVIDKTVRLAYDTYITELGEEVTVDSEGKLSQSHVKYLEGKMENVMNETMAGKGEISSATVFIDPEQNILSTDEIEVVVNVVKVGYAKNISIKIGFVNPAIANLS